MIHWTVAGSHGPAGATDTYRLCEKCSGANCKKEVLLGPTSRFTLKGIHLICNFTFPPNTPGHGKCDSETATTESHRSLSEYLRR